MASNSKDRGAKGNSNKIVRVAEARLVTQESRYMTRPWMVYGAYGYTGELVAREAARRGLRPILAGRSKEKLKPLAEELDLEHRVFDLAQAAGCLTGVSVVLNCAGPFANTVRPLVETCLQHGIHYLDITGEVPVFQFCYSQDARAKDAGIIICPGAGFDVAPTDCLAALLVEAMPDARELNLAFSPGTSPSHGTAKTLVQGLGKGGLVRREHMLVSVPSGYRVRRIPFSDGRRWTVTIPWGDVFTSGVSTGVPDGMVYMAAPLAVGLLMRAANPFRRLLTVRPVKRWLNLVVERRFAGGPDARTRSNRRASLWGEAIDAEGRRIVARLTTPDGYTLTVDTAVDMAAYCLNISGMAGYVTPSMLRGSRYILSRPGVEFEPPI